MGAMTATPGVVSAPNRYYCGAAEVMEYLGCKENNREAAYAQKIVG